MWLLTIRDLRYRLLRVVVVTTLVSLVLSLLYLMSGLVNELEQEPGRAVAAIGADHWVIGPGVSGPFTSASVLPAGASEALAADLVPVVLARGAVRAPAWEDAAEVFVVGHEPGRLGRPRIDEGRGVESAAEIVVDRTLGLEVGDTVELAASTLTVVGVSRDTTILAGLPFAFVEIGVAQDMVFRNRDVVSAYVGVGDMPSGVPGVRVLTADEVAADALRPIESAVTSIDVVRLLLWAVAAIVVGAVVYLSALERQRDFAILKAVGATGGLLGAGLAIQAALIALVASMAGALVALMIEPIVPLQISVPTSAYWRVPLVAVAMGLMAALIGVVRVNRTDPAAAFGGAA